MPGPLREVYDRLLAHYGPQHWWPGDSPCEILIGAVLVQNTNWRNVELAIARLKDASLLTLDAIHAARAEDLAETIRPSGYYRQKARRLKNLAAFVAQEYEGDLEAFFAAPLDTAREQLLALHGIGPETADSILLYAGQRPTFVVDAYTHRVVKRHGWIEHEADYHAVQEEFRAALPDDVPLFNEYHALLVRVGKEHCGPTARCAGCPLESLLPAGGPRDPEWS